jgi:hypothetical protein
LRYFLVAFENSAFSNVEDVEAACSQNTTDEKIAVAKGGIFLTTEESKPIFFGSVLDPLYP